MFVIPEGNLRLALAVIPQRSGGICIRFQEFVAPYLLSRLLWEAPYVYTLYVDVLFRYGGLEFVWDLHKAAANVEKHGIRFERASEVFLDPLCKVLDAGTTEEQRQALLGEAEDRNILFVVHIEQDGEAIRIISARPASPAERRSYEDHA